MSESYELAFSSSGPTSFLALAVEDGKLLEERPAKCGPRGHVELPLSLHDLLTDFEILPALITRAHFDMGPGSFTGLRCACALGQGFGLALPDVRLTAVSAAEALAQAVRETYSDRPLVVVQAWKRETAWVTCFDAAGNKKEESSEKVLLDALQQAPEGALCVGDLPADFKIPDHLQHLPDVELPARSVLAVGRRMAARSQWTSPAELAPIYPREPEAVTLWRQRHG